MIVPIVILISLLQAPADSLSAVQKSFEREKDVRMDHRGSAALYLFSPEAAYTGVDLSWKSGSASTPVYRENGRSLDQGQINIRTLVRPDSSRAVRGAVHYFNGIKREVLWNSSSDYLTVFPYALADTVGGDVHKEEYYFSGGYAARGKRFHWGAEASYRALHEYRMVDPRPRNIVSDLQIAASGGYQLSGSYTIDFTAGYRRYSQAQNMTFLSERGKNSAVFHLTGLGSHFARFSGATDTYMNTRYTGNGFSFGAALAPLRKQAWSAALNYSLLDIVHYLPNLNQVTYTELYTHSIEARIHYLGQNGDLAWKAGAFGNIEWRQGQECILDNGSSGYLKELGRFNMFQSFSSSSGAEAIMEWSAGWSLQARASYRSYDAHYPYPLRHLSYSGMELSIGGGYRFQKGHWMCFGGVHAGLYLPFSGTLQIPSEYTLPQLNNYYTEYYNRVSAREWSGRVRLHGERQITNFMSIYLQASLQLAFPHGFGLARASIISLGINF